MRIHYEDSIVVKCNKCHEEMDWLHDERTGELCALYCVNCDIMFEVERDDERYT